MSNPRKIDLFNFCFTLLGDKQQFGWLLLPYKCMISPTTEKPIDLSECALKTNTLIFKGAWLSDLNLE